MTKLIGSVFAAVLLFAFAFEASRFIIWLANQPYDFALFGAVFTFLVSMILLTYGWVSLIQWFCKKK